MDFQQLQCELLLDRWRNERQLGQPRSACGPTNRISDVAGVRVGHVTLAEGELQTGVTAIVPPGDNLYLTPLPCGAEVLNGFAKPVGLTQVEELGVLHTPILLSNTLAVGTLFTALVRDAIRRNPELGRTLPTVNPLALECNDGWLNDIQALAISEAMAQEALHTAAAHFSRGSVGAGRGMSCFNLKGGIGTASRVIPSLNATLGVLVLANFGALSALTLDGVRLGEVIATLLAGEAPQRDAGSVIIVMATDAPLDARQLKRIAKRAGAGLGRLGSYWGHGSGDIAVAFSTQPLPQPPQDAMLEPLLAAAADATEQAVLDALLSAEPVTGFRGHHRPSLTQILDRLTT
ncbi:MULTISPECIES: P1 family peptidase [Klebsiella]|uniref:DmpA family aminopeptidase n=1 Tax=Klebsiella TaxID=570 RepID=UPI0004525FD3|nr:MULTISPECIES: P1 family peptidase [Klebsiella]VEC46478.1 L-aminopeptidase/D-esterase [Klebsiella aerogenes]HBZ7769303.1 P1 family peptidase [Klebsiella variicola subsp. variicola]HCI6971245.1 P1 family peptidase [Klebsiella quasipneumoniae subsp. similipneumoniae]EKU2839991.1 P1 family peptidase [Klebsiella oxytoca]EKU7503279.1 P1 family peptidase [Klebsiella oxytoca]